MEGYDGPHPDTPEPRLLSPAAVKSEQRKWGSRGWAWIASILLHFTSPQTHGRLGSVQFPTKLVRKHQDIQPGSSLQIWKAPDPQCEPEKGTLECRGKVLLSSCCPNLYFFCPSVGKSCCSRKRVSILVVIILVLVLAVYLIITCKFFCCLVVLS